MLSKQSGNLEKQAKQLVSLIMRELEVDFGKSASEAGKLVRKAGVFHSLIEEPLGLHDSPHNWALIVLTSNNDVDTLEKYYSNH